MKTDGTVAVWTNQYKNHYSVTLQVQPSPTEPSKGRTSGKGTCLQDGGQA